MIWVRTSENTHVIKQKIILLHASKRFGTFPVDLLSSISGTVVAIPWQFIFSNSLGRCCNIYWGVHRNWSYQFLTSWHWTFWCSDNDREVSGSNSAVLTVWGSSRYFLSISRYPGWGFQANAGTESWNRSQSLPSKFLQFTIYDHFQAL